MKHWLFSIIALILATTQTHAAAEPPQFTLPIACTPGKTCWTANYVDMDPAKEKTTDFTCGPRSYDTHKGTDFALRSRAEMREGINVLAALSGTILRMRDGETDTAKAEADLKKIQASKKECGNGILIDHAKAGFPGLSTMYCHLKQGSITVKSGDSVETGQPIAQVGQSGFAEFPHLHFSIVWEGGIIDPYTGLTNTDGCGGHKHSLWKDKTHRYTPVSIYDGGFSNAAPNFTAIKNGKAPPKSLPTTTPALVFWTGFFGVHEGDQITLEIRDPQGQLFANRTITQEKTRARQFYYAGRKRRDITLPPGTYTGHVHLKRDGIKAISKTFPIKLH